MGVTLRRDKGAALTHDEMDDNFDYLDKNPNGKTMPSAKGVGVTFDYDNPEFGWHDLRCEMLLEYEDGDSPTLEQYHGRIMQLAFEEDNSITFNAHIPHDYLPGSDIFIHVHWSHNNQAVTGGSVVWGFEISYAEGYGVAQFCPTKTVSILQEVSPVEPYTHFIAETSASISSGSDTQLDSDLLTVDGLVLGRLHLLDNAIETSDGSTVKPFAHFVDIHYKSTGIPTPNRNPEFWNN